MVGRQDISNSSKRPNMPLEPIFVFSGSPVTMKVTGVPGGIGQWRITHLSFQIKYPDGAVRSAAFARIDSTWVATVSGSSAIGHVAEGYTITAGGYDETGQAVEGYVLGSGDVNVMAYDGTVTPGTSVNFLSLLGSAGERVGQCWLDDPDVPTALVVRHAAGYAGTVSLPTVEQLDAVRDGIAYPVYDVTQDSAWSCGFANLANLHVNTLGLTGTGQTMFTVEAPAGMQRDFLLRLTTEGAPTVTWNFDCETVEGEDWDDMKLVEANKTYLYRFTDVGGENMLASRKEIA